MHGRGICAARDRARDTAPFRTNGRCLFTRSTSPRRKMAFSSRYRKVSHGEDLRTRTPQGDGNIVLKSRFIRLFINLRTRTPQGDGNCKCIATCFLLCSFKNQNPARGRKPFDHTRKGFFYIDLRTRTPQGDGNSIRRGEHSAHGIYLRTRTPQGDGNPSSRASYMEVRTHLRTRTPQGDGNYEVFSEQCR